MAVPDCVCFGPKVGATGEYTYGDIRAMKVDAEKFAALRARLDTWLIGQIGKVEKARAPFPLAILTCVGIETMAQVAYGDSPKNDSGRSFKTFLKKIDPELPRQLTKKRKEEFSEQWPAANHLKTYADILYTFFRNSLIHFYRGRGVYLDKKFAGEPLEWEFSGGLIYLNPYWFWEKFVSAYGDSFDEMAKHPARAEYKNAIQYVDELLN